MKEVEALLEKYGITLEFIDLEIPGCYISDIKTMFVSEALNNFETIKVILHEAGHGVLHDDLEEIYKMNGFHSKMEYQADCFMITELVRIYISLIDIDIQEFNYIQFIEQNELDFAYEDLIKQVASDYAQQVSFG